MTDMDLMERLGKLDSGQAKIAERVGQHHNIVTGQLDGLRNDVHYLNVQLTGNGHPEGGLLYRVLGIEQRIGTAVRVFGWAAAIFGAILATMLVTRFEACERLVAVPASRLGASTTVMP